MYFLNVCQTYGQAYQYMREKENISNLWEETNNAHVEQERRNLLNPKGDSFQKFAGFQKSGTT